MAIESLIAKFEPAYKVDVDEINKISEVVVCLRCGRPLTNEKSRLARLGRKCARKLAYETRTHSFSPKTLQHQISFVRTFHGDSIPTQDISIYYSSKSSTKPYCKVGTVTLTATDICTSNDNDHRKRTYSLPLFEGVIYEIMVPLPQARIFWLQVRDQQLTDISSMLTFRGTK